MHKHPFDQARNDRHDMGASLEPFDHVQDFAGRAHDDLCFEVELIDQLSEFGNLAAGVVAHVVDAATEDGDVAGACKSREQALLRAHHRGDVHPNVVLRLELVDDLKVLELTGLAEVFQIDPLANSAASLQ